MAFVDDDRVHTGEFGVVLESSYKDPCGHHLDSGASRHGAFTSHGVTDFVTDTSAGQPGHPGGCGSRGNSAGFCDDDSSRDLVGKCKRHEARLAGPRGRNEDGCRIVSQRRTHLRQH